jgi:DNA-binding PadR family transcriptional regulator
MSMRKLRELEGAVLGVVSQHGPLTPYQVRKVFAHSPNPHWNASAGSIYPLIARLSRRRLLAARHHATGARNCLKYSLTTAGLRVLRTWISNIEQTKITTTSDLVRLRVFFLAVLTPAEQRRFVEHMILKISAAIAKDEVYCRKKLKAGDTFAYLGSRGAVLMSRARFGWLKEVRSKLPR